MPTVIFYLTYCAILSIAEATVLSHQASSLGHNTSSKGILTPSGAFPGLGNFSTVPRTSLTTTIISNSTLHNDTNATSALSSNSCCFVVQDTINVRYWEDTLTSTTTYSNQITSLITVATQYVDTTVMTNVSTVIKNLNVTSGIISVLGTPDIPNTNNDAPGPSVVQVGLNPSLTNTFGATLASPTQFYLFPSVNIINVPAVFDVSGRPACATESTYFTTCPAQTYSTLNLTTTNYTENTGANNALYFPGINSNAEAYFGTGPDQGTATIPIDFHVVQVSFSTPFVYAPVSDQFPSDVVKENLGYVPQTLIEWIAQDSDYIAKFPGIASCLPGGPSIDFSNYFCPPPPRGGVINPFFHVAQPQPYLQEPGLTVSLTVTVTGAGCFHPGECPTTAAPGATAIAGTAEVTPGAVQSQNAGKSNTVQAGNPSPPASPGKASPPQLPSPPTPAPVEAPGDTPVVSAEGNAANPLPIPPLSPSPNDPATPPSNSQGLGAIVAGAFGITPTPLPGDEDIKPTPGPTPIISYSISIAPSASAVIVNGVTSVLPTEGSSEPVLAGPLPITVGSQPVTQNAASQYVVDGQTLTPGAPPINLQGTEVSLAPSASAIVIAGSTIVLSSAGAPAFTVGVETFTADDASQYAAGGQTLTPGGPAVTISGTRLSLAPGGTQVVVGSSTIGIIPTFTPPSLPLLPLTLGSQTYTADSNYHYTIASQTLTPGGPAVTISGTRVSLAPGGTEAVVGGSTIELTPTFTPSSPVPILTLGSQTYTAESNSAYIIDGQILIPGGSAITVSGTRLSLAPSATQFIIGSSAIILSPGITPPPITFDSQTFTANALSSYIIDSQTLIPGGPAITISGTRLSLAADGLNAIVGTSTSTLLPSPRPTFPPLTIASHLITANPLGLYIIGSQTLTPGGPAITISGTRLSVAADGLSAIVGTSTSLLLPLSLPFSGPTRNPPPLTIASHLITANAAGLYIIGTQTLIPGSSGIVIPASAFPPKSVFTIGSQTFTANPTAFSIDGTEISAGGAGVTIAGTGVRLGGGGLLVVGNGSVVLGAGVGGSGSGGVRNSGIGVGAFKGEARRGRGGRGGGLLVMLMMVVGLLGVGLLG